MGLPAFTRWSDNLSAHNLDVHMSATPHKLRSVHKKIGPLPQLQLQGKRLGSELPVSFIHPPILGKLIYGLWCNGLRMA
eukprot:3834276-Amphidinium_carterae.2